MAQFCSSCGAQIADGSTACPSCGKAAGVGGGAAAAPAPAQASGGLEENVAGMLAYITIIPAIIFLVIEPYNKNKFVRFHSFQCLFFSVAMFALGIVLSVLTAIPVLGWIVGLLGVPLLWLASLVIWIVLLMKAYKHEMFKLPVIGEIAAKQAGA
jgi:uncharacterized membrane protein